MYNKINIIKSRSIFQLFLILISLSLTLNSLVIIPFKVNSIKEIQIEKDYNSTNFISEYFHRDFYANLITGIPSKSILTLLDTNSHIFEFVENFLDKQSLYEIVDPENKISKSTYDSSKSLSFQNISIQHYSNAELKTASLCSETFLLYQDLSMAQTTPVEGLKFFIDEGLGNDLHIKLGLNKPTTKDYQGPPHFIQSLLDVGAIKEESWTFKFSSENDGIFILGGLPHTYQDISKDKKYQRQYYFETSSLNIKDYHNPWSISAQKVYMKDTTNGEDIIINENKGCYINYNLGFIIGTKEYREYIKKNFFDELIDLGICSYDLVHFKGPNDVENRYYAISCDKFKFKLNDFKKQYYEKFPKLYFYIFDYNYNFELTKEDLFTEVNDKLYFMIIFERVVFEHPELINWNLGYPFLKKYEFVHNFDKETIGFYLPYEEEKKDEKEKEKEEEDENKNEEKGKEKNEKSNNETETDTTIEPKKNDNNKKYIIIIIVVCIISILLIIVTFFIAKNMYQSRKGRANELKDDDFDYNAQNNNEKEIN